MEVHLFYKVARRLYEDLDEANPDEGFVRTIISRAFFAMLLVLRDKAGLSTKGRRGHQHVLDYYKKEKGEVGSVINELMKDLKDMRVKADYEMNDRFTARHAEMSLCLCEWILGEITKISRRNLAVSGIVWDLGSKICKTQKHKNTRWA